MMPFTRKLTVVAAVVGLVVSSAFGQMPQSSRSWNSESSFDSWTSPRGSNFRPASNSRELDWRSPLDSGDQFAQDELSGPAILSRTSDPFRPAANRSERLSLQIPARSSNPANGLPDRSESQVRYRVPLDRVPLDRLDRWGPGSGLQSPSLQDRNLLDTGALNRDYFDRSYPDRSDQERGYPGTGLPSRDYNDLEFRDRLPSGNGRDPFVPAPLPRGRVDEEAKLINDMISARYQNPVNVRALRAMSTDQAVQLFAEVSKKIDERHVEPATYDVRVRRALRNLTIALDNPVFAQALGMTADSFRTDSFRNALGTLAGSLRVTGYQDARNVMTTVMQSAQSVSGLTPTVVAFEFANASLDSLDKFSGLEPSEPGSRSGADSGAGARTAALEDQIVGVGVEVKADAQGLLVVKALRGGPAAEAGIQSGDLIVAIDGRSISGMPMASSVDLMKGTTGSRMVLRIYRAEKGERDFTLTRRTVRVWTVNDTRLIPAGNVGYLSLSRFAQNSTAELDQALMELHNKGMESLVIDLRGNPGGLLTTCVEISDRFVPCGTIVSTKGRLNSDNMLEKATYAKTWSTPLVVLVDGDSASASEIFAAAVQENGRGVVVGTKSYGKGTVQTHFPLGAISGNLRLTTAHFYSPNGRAMSGQGVTPDVVVNDADGIANGDQVLTEALRIANSSKLQEMAKSAGTCRTGSPSVGRSSSLDNFNDPISVVSVVR